jgi:hypothetical protein
MRTLVFVLATLTAAMGYGQFRPLSSDRVPSGPDVDDLYARLAESAYVVKGRVLAAEAVSLRTPSPAVQVGPHEWRLHYSLNSGGVFFTVAVEEIICRQEDLAIAPSAPAPSPSLVHVFYSLGEPQSTLSKFDPYRHNRREFLLPGREYLLFLYAPSGQDMLVKTYNLEPGVTYYRTVEGERGAVALPDAASPERPYTFLTPLVKAVTTFCEAVKGPNAATKIRQLQGVRDLFDYPAWRQSVDAAIRGFQTAAPQPPQQ